MHKLKTPYYLINEHNLLKNLNRIDIVRNLGQTKILLALKCFSTWSTFKFLRKYIDGSTSSSLFEAKLGHSKIGGETHAYCVGYKKDELETVSKFSDKIIFNSISQLNALGNNIPIGKIGLRINPGISHSEYDLANPSRQYSRLGVSSIQDVKNAIPYIGGLMFHFNCENNNFQEFSEMLKHIEKEYGYVLRDVNWVSLGGGISFTDEDYPLHDFADLLKRFRIVYDVETYLEPGEAIVKNAAHLYTSIVDITKNDKEIAIVDASKEAHMLDALIYDIDAEIEDTNNKGYNYQYVIAGRSCLAGDVFGEYRFPFPLKVGDCIRIKNAAAYTMVKTNWFNGLQMPSIAIKRLSGKIDIIRTFNYNDFIHNIS